MFRYQHNHNIPTYDENWQKAHCNEGESLRECRKRAEFRAMISIVVVMTFVILIIALSAFLGPPTTVSRYPARSRYPMAGRTNYTSVSLF